MPKFFRNFADSNFIDTHAEFISIFPDNRPDIDFLCCFADDIAFAYHMGRLRIPHIIGMVLAGVLVGKYGLNILGRDASFELFGRVGLYYIMFLAGLEMDMEGLKKNRNRVRSLVC